MKVPEPALSPLAADSIDEIEAMILRLIEMRHVEQSAESREDFRHAIDRLDALAYRLKAAAAVGRVVGRPKLPVPVAAPPVSPKLPQTALPLGPVIVQARRSRN